jgi:formylglycine-generating enzyme required for sulfatase activity
LSKFIVIKQLDGTEQQFVETDLPVVIGSHENSHVRLPGVDPVCGYIARDKGHFYIQPSSSKEELLFHNDHFLTSSAWLKSNDRIRVGHYLVLYSLSGDRLTITVTETAEEQPLPDDLQPPSLPPPDQPLNHKTDHQIPVGVAARGVPDKKRRIALAITGLIFLILGCAVFFVLSAKPLQMIITPEPDRISFKGFPPPITLGSRFLGLPGTYKVSIEKEGYVAITRSITINRSADNQFNATLEKLPGILSLSVIPEGSVAIYSGDQFLASSPPQDIEIPAGLHKLRLERERYQPYNTEIDIEGMGRRQDLAVTLQPDWATIAITSDPPDAIIKIDDRPAGKTPLSVELLSGDHSLMLARELFIDSEKTISVAAGRTETYHFPLQPLPGQLSLVSHPTRGAVRINKIYKGSTPLTVTLAPDEQHEILVSLAGYHAAGTTVTLEPGEKKHTELTLEREKGIVYLLITPPQASVTLDGMPLEQKQGKLNLSVKAHTLEVQAEGHRSQTRTFTPKAGFSQQVTIDLKPLAGQLPAPPRANVQQSPVASSAGQRLLFVQPTSFIMGAPRREPGRRANEHERTVALTRPFYLSQKPVTNSQFRLFNKEHTSGEFGGNSLDTGKQPVVNITWEEAVSYLNWLSSQDNLEPFYQKQGSSFIGASPLTNGYRLPTEAEWAFSARQVGSPKAQRFPWSGGFPPTIPTGNFADESARNLLPRIINGYQDRHPVTSPVGSFPPNKGGFFDMGGNIAEWCHDFYSPTSASKTNLTDPLGPPSGMHHVIRGSSWKDSSITELRLSYRAYHKQARNNVGFRVARYQ